MKMELRTTIITIAILMINMANVTLTKADDDSGVRGYFRCTRPTPGPASTPGPAESRSTVKEESTNTPTEEVGYTNDVGSDVTFTGKDVDTASEPTIHTETTSVAIISSTQSTVDVTSTTSDPSTTLPAGVQTTQTSINQSCSVFMENITILDHGSFEVNENCTKKFTCTNGNTRVNEAYTCSSSAECDKRNGVRKCYCERGYQGNGETCMQMTNCLDYFDANFTDNGIYTIKPINWTGSPFGVLCNMTDGGGWTVFQRRVDGSVDFYRNWTSYKEGFGELDHEFWLGNDKLYYLSNQGDYQIRIDLVNVNGVPYYAKYDLFRINDESDNYTLSEVGNFNGTTDPTGGFNAAQAFSYHVNNRFSTFDSNSGTCPEDQHGAWWNKGCSISNLNGEYNGTGQTGIKWANLPGGEYNITYTEMKIRPL
ncbi:uncharacterized protein [Apostichopus japonicus]|uniref:uncharacterized protein n=1 Tax=Stichopus japonicus TaxID=307972 RepID=UPI003AB6B64C